MPARHSPRPKKKKPEKEPPSRFAPAKFLKGTTAEVQALCDELATLAAERFDDLTGTTWERTGRTLAQQLREAGHDLTCLDEDSELQDWHASWHHPRGTFSLMLSFRAPRAVEITWTADDMSYTARR
jgi:hypothetical protein